MRPASRLFQIIQILRRARRRVRAKDLAEELETSCRTIYRDIAKLGACGVPIQGEAGQGYLLDRSYDMPPLMLTADEIEAAVVGVRWVASRGDPKLAAGAQDLIAKISSAIPRGLRSLILEGALLAPATKAAVADQVDMGRVRRWIRERRKLQVDYQNESGHASSRILWPIAVAYFDDCRLIAAWCELRREFRHFRADRIRGVVFLKDPIPRSRRDLVAEWRDSELRRNYCSPKDWELR